MTIADHSAGPATINPPPGLPRVLPHLIYDDVDAAVAWLTRVFGFAERARWRHTGADGVIQRTQMQVLDSVITLGRPSVHGGSPRRGVSSMLYVYVDDVDQHHRCAVEAGATVVAGPATRPWGDRVYQTGDPEGHQWTFATHVDDADTCDHHG